MRVLLIGENVKTSKSGVVTVMKQLLEDDYINSKVSYKVIYTTGDGFSTIRKIFGWAKAYLLFLYYLPTCKIIHVHHASDLNFWLSSVFVFLTRYTNRKIILHNHGADFHEFYNRCNTKQKKRIGRIFKIADTTIVLSESWLKWHKSSSPEANWTLLPNAIQVPKKLYEKKVFEKEIIIVYLARIEQRKGFFDFLQIIPELIRQYPSCKIHIAGQGDSISSKQFIKEKGLTDNVFFLGYINPEERNSLLQKSHVLVLPSYNEGLPMSLLEAMSYCVVPVTTNVGGIPEVVLHGTNGIMVQPGDKPGLLNGIGLALNNKKSFDSMSKSAYEKVLTDYNFENYKEKVLEVYYSVQ
jgi:glycosyltransferase involved in cell wall biosynthesis